jgi:taurine dioxygenase
MDIIIRPLSPFGAEVIGLDLDDEAALDAATSRALREAWVEHGILLFRHALHSESAHLRLSRVFGIRSRRPSRASTTRATRS